MTIRGNNRFKFLLFLIALCLSFVWQWFQETSFPWVFMVGVCLLLFLYSVIERKFFRPKSKIRYKGEQGTLEEADAQLRSLVPFLDGVLDEIRAHPLNQSEVARLEGHDYFYSLLSSSILSCTRDLPGSVQFRHYPKDDMRLGLDNPDNLYLSFSIQPGNHYKIWGVKGNTSDLVFQIYCTNRYKGGRALDYRHLAFDENGYFEVHVCGERPEPTSQPHLDNWLELDSKEPWDTLLLRECHNDWDSEYAGQYNAEQCNVPIEAPTPRSNINNLEYLKERLLSHIDYGKKYIAMVEKAVPPNFMGKLRRTLDDGLQLQFSAFGRFELHEDEVLLLEIYDLGGPYQGLQLGNFWFQSLEHRYHQSSLTSAQAYKDDDGLIRMVISLEDPGVPNWLDPCGNHQGLIFLRSQGLDSEPSQNMNPIGKLLKKDQLRNALPPNHPYCNEDKRKDQIQRRITHLNRRAHTGYNFKPQTRDF